MTTSTDQTARDARNAAVRQAIADGWTHAQIANATGLTRSRIGQIALGQATITTAPPPTPQE